MRLRPPRLPRARRRPARVAAQAPRRGNVRGLVGGCGHAEGSRSTKLRQMGCRSSPGTRQLLVGSALADRCKGPLRCVAVELRETQNGRVDARICPRGGQRGASGDPVFASWSGEVPIRMRTSALNPRDERVRSGPARSCRDALAAVERRFGARRAGGIGTDRPGTHQPIRRSLIGFDGSVASLSALHYAAGAARDNRGCLVVVSVVRRPTEIVAAWPFAVAAPPSESPEQYALAAVRAAVETLPADLSVLTIVCHGRPGPVLLREAAHHLCDAIVIGAPSGVRSRLTGGLARYLRSHAAVDVVLIARPNSGALPARPLSAPEPLQFGL